MFLKAERCAIALQQNAKAGCSATARNAIDSAALREMQRALAARAAAREFGEEALQRGWSAVALKGTSYATQLYIDVADLDLLVAPQDFSEIARVYEAKGYAVYDKGPTLNVFPALSGFPLDVHSRIREFDYDTARSEPSDFPGLRRMQLLDLIKLHILHAGLVHGDRRGSIRDLLFLRDILRLCTPMERAAFQSFLASHPQSDILCAMVGAASGERDDPYRRSTALRYNYWRRLSDQKRGPVGLLLSGLMMRWGADRADGVTPQPLDASQHGVSSVPAVAAMEKRYPRFGRAFRRGGRWAGSLLAGLVSVVSEIEARTTLYLWKRRGN